MGESPLDKCSLVLLWFALLAAQTYTTEGRKYPEKKLHDLQKYCIVAKTQEYIVRR